VLAVRGLNAHSPVFIVLEGTRILGSRMASATAIASADRGVDRRALSGAGACGEIRRRVPQIAPGDRDDARRPSGNAADLGLTIVLEF